MTKILNKPTAPAVLRDAINRWIKRKYGKDHSKWYTMKAWRERGEPYGDHAVGGVLIIEESPLYVCLNYGEDGWKADTELRTLCEKHGYYFQMLYAWALGFYKA